MEKLMEDMVVFNRQEKHEKIVNPPAILGEQLVSVVVDNVTGKHYERKPKWIYVKEKGKAGKKRKYLYCSKFEEPKIDWDWMNRP
jgi:hypothetical protein